MLCAVFCQQGTGGSLLSLYRRANGSEIRQYHSENFFKLAASQMLSKICRAAAVEKIAMRRLIS